MASADGTEYQIVIRSRRTKSTSRGPTKDKPSGMSETHAPLANAAYRSKTERSKWNGAWLDRRSPGWGSSSSSAHSMNASAFPWLMHTPLGRPVDPDV